MPETCGVAIDVPESIVKPLSAEGSRGDVAANIFTPGAPISGCSSPKKKKKKTNVHLLFHLGS